MTWNNRKEFENEISKRYWSSGYHPVIERKIVKENGSIAMKYMFNGKHVATWIDGKGGWFE